MNTIRLVGRRAVHVALVLALVSAQAPSVAGQTSDGSATTSLGAGALGAYSGAVLGLVGAMGPCNRLLSGALCPRAAAALGGALGLAAGVVHGSNDSSALRARLGNVGYGALAGGLVGLGLSGVVRQYGWPDPVAFAAVGAAIGASPEGAGVGFAAGATVGALAWMALPRWKVGDAISVAVAGLALGGIVGWAWEAADSRSGASTPPAAVFSVPLPIRVP